VEDTETPFCVFDQVHRGLHDCEDGYSALTHSMRITCAQLRSTERHSLTAVSRTMLPELPQRHADVGWGSRLVFVGHVALSSCVCDLHNGALCATGTSEMLCSLRQAQGETIRCCRRFQICTSCLSYSRTPRRPYVVALLYDEMQVGL